MIDPRQVPRALVPGIVLATVLVAVGCSDDDPMTPTVTLWEEVSLPGDLTGSHLAYLIKGRSDLIHPRGGRHICRIGDVSV